MKAVVDVLAAIGEIEWVRCTGSELAHSIRPPLVAWRFKEVDQRREAAIVASVGAFSGKTHWSIKKGERNWVIEPELFSVFARDFRVDVDALEAFGLRHPSETRAALEDAEELAEHMRRTLLHH